MDRVNLLEWIESKSALEAYIEWRNDPVTQIIIDGIKNSSKPHRLQLNANHQLDANAAIQELGFQAGRASVIDVLENLDLAYSVSHNSSHVEENLLDHLVNAEGYTKEQATQMLKKEQEEDG